MATKKSFPSIYRLIPIASESPDANPSGGPLVETEEYLVQGSLHDHLIISVPASISHQSAYVLTNKLAKEFEKPLVVVTHNINFLKLERLSKEEAEAVTERVTSRVVEEKLALEQLKQMEAERDPTKKETDSAPEKGVDDSKASGGDGGGSGLRLVGGSDPRKDQSGSDAGGSGGQGGCDEES